MKIYFKYITYSFLFGLFFSFPVLVQGQNYQAIPELNDVSDFSIGIHTGIFDSNQSVYFPYNIGINSKFEYTPDIFKKLFLGTEAGMFFTASQKDKLGRETRLVFADVSLYPGISIPLKSGISPDDKPKTIIRKLKRQRKIKLALGLNIAIPIKKQSYGSGVNNNAIRSGIGLTLRTSYDLPNRITVFANVSRISKDLDGYAYKSENSSERSNGNKYNVSYIMKLGVSWNFLRKD